jgi:ABC-type lipoprotein export system ATPase subunit
MVVPMIKLENISKSFQINREDFTVLKNVNLEIQEGEFVGILGRSGSGNQPC